MRKSPPKTSWGLGQPTAAPTNAAPWDHTSVWAQEHNGVTHHLRVDSSSPSKRNHPGILKQKPPPPLAEHFSKGSFTQIFEDELVPLLQLAGPGVWVCGWGGGGNWSQTDAPNQLLEGPTGRKETREGVVIRL